MHETRRKSNVTLGGSIITENGLDTKKEWYKKVREDALLTTGHGIPRIVEASNSIFKLIWTVCLLTSLGMCIYMVYRSIDQYLQFDVVTRIKFIEEPEMVFPVVSFCSINTFASRAAYDYLRAYYNTTYNVSVETYREFAQLVANNTITDDTEWIMYETYKPDFNDSVRRSLDVSANQMISYCTFNENPCNASEFVWYYDPLYGICFKFNSGFDSEGNPVPIYTVNREGGGLSVQLFTGLSDSLYNYLYEPENRGIIILIDDQANFMIKNTNGVLNSGLYSKVTVAKTLTELMPSPYGECLDETNIRSRLANEMRRLGYNYSRKNCITFCEQQQTIDAIGCYDMRLPQIFNASACSTRPQFEKLKNLTFDYTRCLSECPFECSSVSYAVTTSYADYPSYDFYVSEIVNKPAFYQELFKTTDVTYQSFSDGIGGVFIGFDRLRYTHLSDNPSFEIMDIFANVGGTLGLFLGFSILSFVELFDVIYKVIMATCHVYRERAKLKQELEVEKPEQRI